MFHFHIYIYIYFQGGFFLVFSSLGLRQLNNILLHIYIKKPYQIKYIKSISAVTVIQSLKQKISALSTLYVGYLRLSPGIQVSLLPSDNFIRSRLLVKQSTRLLGPGKDLTCFLIFSKQLVLNQLCNWRDRKKLFRQVLEFKKHKVAKLFSCLIAFITFSIKISMISR